MDIYNYYKQNLILDYNNCGNLEKIFKINEIKHLIKNFINKDYIEFNCKNGLLDYYYNKIQNNNLIISCFYKNMKLDGEFLQWRAHSTPSKNKELIKKINFINGKKNGLFLSFFNKNDKNKKKILCYYKDDILDGEYYEFYYNQNIKIKCNYINDKLNDKFIKNFLLNKLHIECNYKDNKKEGIYKEYFKNGDIYIECNYNNDKKNGIYKEYKDFYKEFYNYNGMFIECNYKDDKKNGLYQEWSDLGELNIKRTYVEDKIIDQIIYNNESVRSNPI